MRLIQKLGMSSPLGSSVTREGVNFSVFSKHASHLFLCIYELESKKRIAKLPLNRTHSFWHIELINLPLTFAYTYIACGPYDPKKGHMFRSEIELTDPYAKCLDAFATWGTRQKRVRTIYQKSAPFDWENIGPPCIPQEELIIYEMHVRSFTKHLSSRVKHPGTFLGMVEKIPYLKTLGINAVELMPIHEFSEIENARTHPETGEILYNYWGYATVNFFMPMRRYGTAEELKILVKELHREKIEVILDVVYNHTLDVQSTNGSCPFSGLDNVTYYIFDQSGYHNYTGCGHTLKCQHPIVQQLIIDSLRYWVTEFHIDGFRFDLAATLTRDESGQPLEDPPLIKRIEQDPVLEKTKLIAEPWDPGGLYQLGHFPSRFAQWNGKFRDDVRRFIRGDGNVEAMKDCLMGFPSLYPFPLSSINFITTHDGFTLFDLVSYNKKENRANGEDNRDGIDENFSWNCGVEGKTNTLAINELRFKQMRNLLLALFLSQGIPMLLMGDEYGHTRFGNNNAYCQDNALNYFLWDKEPLLFSFIQQLILIRKKYPILRQKTRTKNVRWEKNGYLGMTLSDELFVAFNPSSKKLFLNKEGWALLISTGEHSSCPGKLGPYESVVLGKK